MADQNSSGEGRRWTIHNVSKRFTVEKANASPIPLGSKVEVAPVSELQALQAELDEIASSLQAESDENFERAERLQAELGRVKGDLEHLELANDDAVDFAANEPEKIARCLPEPVRAAVLASGGTRLESEERLRRAFATQRDEAWARNAKLERERDELAEARADQMQAIAATQQRAEAAQALYEELKAGVEGKRNEFRGAAEKAQAEGQAGVGRAAAFFVAAHDLTALLNQKDKGEPEPCDEDPDAPWPDEISVSIPPKNLRNVRVHKAPCETCGGSGGGGQVTAAPRFEFVERPAPPFALAGDASSWVPRRWSWRLLDGEAPRAVSAGSFADRTAAESDARSFADFVRRQG